MMMTPLPSTRRTILLALLLLAATAAPFGTRAQGLEASDGNIKDDAGDDKNNVPTAAPVITEYWDFVITNTPTSAPVIVDYWPTPAAADGDEGGGQPEVDEEPSGSPTSTQTNGGDSSNSNNYTIIRYVVIGAVVCCGIALIALGWTICKHCCCQQQPQPDQEKPGGSTRIAADDDRPVLPETTDRTLEDSDELLHRDVVLDLESGVVPRPNKHTRSSGASISDNHSHHSRGGGSYCSGRSNTSRSSSNSRPLLHCPKLDHYNSHDNRSNKNNRKNAGTSSAPRFGGSARFGDPHCYLVSANLVPVAQ